MKTIVAGSRSITEFAVVETAIRDSGFIITELVSGAARGVDELGERWAHENNVPIKRFPADWKRFGKSAGPRRNTEMAQYVGGGGGLIAIWDGKSRGTANMIETAHASGLRVFVHQEHA